MAIESAEKVGPHILAFHHHPALRCSPPSQGDYEYVRELLRRLQTPYADPDPGNQSSQSVKHKSHVQVRSPRVRSESTTSVEAFNHLIV